MECFHFYRQVAQELVPKLAVALRHLVRCSFPACWILADVVSVPKGSASSGVGN